jgi:hypothetical protein
MTLIKLSYPYTDWPILRQTPGSTGIWGDCRFCVNQNIPECDYWIVYNELLAAESVKCPPENTVFIAGEPASVKEYEPDFLKQFATVISSARGLSHPHVINTQTALSWHVGRRYRNKINVAFTKDYDELKSIKAFRKDKLISIISSNVTLTEGHKRRQDFTHRLCQHFGPQIDFFGRGIRDIEDKWDAISSYKYHVVIENSFFSDYWTEKLADAFLGGAYPFYYGCPNVFDYFPPGCLTPIDINDFEESVKVIEAAIESRKYEDSVAELAAARDLVLDTYNLFPMMSNFSLEHGRGGKKKRIVLRPEHFSPEPSRLSKQLYGIKTRLRSALRGAS